MLRIPCPWCGVRDEIEFRYKGDATLRRPSAANAASSGSGAGDGVTGADPVPLETQAFVDYVYQRDNPRGWHVEWWLHAAGCRQLLQVRRHTLTHEIAAVAKAGEPLSAGDA